MTRDEFIRSINQLIHFHPGAWNDAKASQIWIENRSVFEALDSEWLAKLVNGVCLYHEPHFPLVEAAKAEIAERKRGKAKGMQILREIGATASIEKAKDQDE